MLIFGFSARNILITISDKYNYEEHIAAKLRTVSFALILLKTGMNF